MFVLEVDAFLLCPQAARMDSVCQCIYITALLVRPLSKCVYVELSLLGLKCVYLQCSQ